MEGRPLHNASRTRKSMGHLNFNSNIDIGTNTYTYAMDIYFNYE